MKTRRSEAATNLLYCRSTEATGFRYNCNGDCTLTHIDNSNNLDLKAVEGEVDDVISQDEKGILIFQSFC